MMSMVVSPKSTKRYGFKCSCCLLVKVPNKRGRDAERRAIKRRERQADRLELASS